ncbi:MAG TPA: aldo/keto reductase [Polyangiaceae bacterium]|nr:aldo/keto reductase [Polyangiaceae bacterium]
MASAQLPRHVFGPTGVSVPKVGLGTWYLEQTDAKAAIAAVHAALELGLTHVDTAELYGSGKAESLVGQALEGRRDEVFLVSKIIPSNASRQGTIQHCEQTLKRLRTDHLDCYLLHWPGSYPLEDTIEALEELVTSGKTRAWGVSNFDEGELEQALDIAGPGRIACNQVLYHLQERSIEHAVLPWCEANGVAVVGYTPFGQNRQFPPRGPGGAVLSQLAERLGATTRQLALAFLTRRSELFAIPKSTQLEHLRENAGGATVVLSSADIAAIDSAFPVGRRRRGVPML